MVIPEWLQLKVIKDIGAVADNRALISAVGRSIMAGKGLSLEYKILSERNSRLRSPQNNAVLGDQILNGGQDPDLRLN